MVANKVILPQGPTDIMTELMTAISHISSSPGRLEQSSQNLEGVLNSSLKDNETLQVTKLTTSPSWNWCVDGPDVSLTWLFLWPKFSFFRAFMALSIDIYSLGAQSVQFIRGLQTCVPPQCNWRCWTSWMIAEILVLALLARTFSEKRVGCGFEFRSTSTLKKYRAVAQFEIGAFLPKA